MNDILPLFGIKKARISRRSLLRASARSGIGAAAIALVGCGENNNNALGIGHRFTKIELLVAKLIRLFFCRKIK